MKTTIALIREYFFTGAPTGEALKEIKALSTQDKIELGSAIAREMNIPNSELKFDSVPY